MTVFYDKSKQKWVAQAYWVDRDGKAHRPKRQARTKGEAKRLERELEAEKEGGVLQQRADAITIADVFRRHLPAVRPDLSPTSYQSYEEVARLHVMPWLGAVAVADLVPVQIVDWLAALREEGLGSRTVQKAYETLGRALNWAVRHGIAHQNVAKKVAKPRHRETEVQIITHAQERSVLDAAAAIGPMWEALFSLMANGLSRSEAFGVRRCDIDLGAGTVRVRQALKAVRGELLIGPLKTAARRRTVPLKRRSLEAILRHLGALPATPLPTSKALLFTERTGGPLRFSNVTRRQWARAKSAVPDLPDPLGFHALRHTFVVQLLEVGTPAATVARLSGHSTPHQVLTRYGDHVRDGDVVAAIERLDAAMEGSSLGSSRGEQSPRTDMNAPRNATR